MSPRKVENERGWAVQPSDSRVDIMPVEIGRGKKLQDWSIDRGWLL